MKKIINESTVLNFYLEQMDADNITFLHGKKNVKDEIRILILKLNELPDIHMKIQVAKELWKILFEHAMGKLNTDKNGYDKLFKYFDEYVNFEELIFASDSFYRDHTLHCLWVYFLGEYLYNQKEFKNIFKYVFKENENLLHLEEALNKEEYDEMFKPLKPVIGSMIRGMQNSDAIRCLNALTHDLGYPLKKIKKINNSISNILPYFSINHFDEFNFTYSNEQKSTIEAFLNLITLDLKFAAGVHDDNLGAKFEKVFNINEDGTIVGFNYDEIDKFNKSDKELFIKMLTPKIDLKRDVSKFSRFSEDFENYEHGIMSAFILFKTLGFNKNFRMRYGNMNDVESSDLDTETYLYTYLIYNAISNHTSPSYKIKSISDTSAFLILIDELEEFSRISRADQNRSYIAEFCKSSIYMDEDVFCVDFIFDNKDIVNLDPERAFKGRCKKMISLFDIPNLDKDFKLKLRCIDHLWETEKVYQLEIQHKFAKITIDTEEQIIPKYLHSRELYTREEYANL